MREDLGHVRQPRDGKGGTSIIGRKQVESDDCFIEKCEVT